MPPEGWRRQAGHPGSPLVTWMEPGLALFQNLCLITAVKIGYGNPARKLWRDRWEMEGLVI